MNTFKITLNSSYKAISIIVYTILFVVAGYFVFDSGFMQLRLPFIIPEGIPIGEILLILVLPLLQYKKILRKLNTVFYCIPIILWWFYGLIMTIIGFFNYGSWALRDATSMIESLYLILGFLIALNPKVLFGFLRKLPIVLVIVSIYALGYPMRNILISFSPTVFAAAGYQSSLLFTYTAKYLTLICTSMYFFIFQGNNKIKRLLGYSAIIFLLLFSIVFYQARTIYFQIIALLIYFHILGYKKLNKLYFGLFLILLIITITNLMGFEVKGRLGQTVSASFIFEHFLSSFGVTNEGVEGSAGGSLQRIDWFSICISKWLSSYSTMFFGVGYGLPLTDFTTIVVVREPHNSFLSLLTRLGLVGILLYLWNILTLFLTWKNTINKLNLMQWVITKKYLIWIMSFFILVFVLALTEDALEKPFIAIPFYFIWGILLGLIYYIKKHFNNESKNEDPLAS